MRALTAAGQAAMAFMKAIRRNTSGVRRLSCSVVLCGLAAAVGLILLLLLSNVGGPRNSLWRLKAAQGWAVSTADAGAGAGPGASEQVQAAEAALGITWKANQPRTAVCTDTCSKAKDGVCDDGRFAAAGGPAVDVLCDLGTDCSDCGSWGGHIPRWTGPGTGPISFARSQNATVRVKVTTTQPAFLMPITIKELDPDVSAMVDNYGHLEGGVTRVVHEVLGANQCTPAEGHRRLVLDVGANFGYFALYAASMGCRVIAWEPIQLFTAFLHYGIAINNLTARVTVREAAVSHNQTSVNVGIPKDGTYWGLASVNNLNLMPREVKQVVRVPAERIDAVASEPVMLLKVDVEGYEREVMASATNLMALHVLLEYSPGIFERSKDFEGLANLASSLKDMLSKGFVGGHIPMRVATPWPPKTMEEHYASHVPLFEEISSAGLELDIRAAKMRLQVESGAKRCPVPDELKRFPVWAHCNEWAYAAHPKGFRSSFGFNTNLWLSHRFQRIHVPPSASLAEAMAAAAPHLTATPTGVLKLAGHASLFALEQDMKVWTSERNKGQSIGFMACSGLGASHKLIFRCPCTLTECEEEKRVIDKLLRAGRMPMQDW